MLKPLLLGACDEHTWRVSGRKAGAGYVGTEFQWYGRFPVEILFIFRLREELGLPNPALNHPLMNTALGKLPTLSETKGKRNLGELVGPVIAKFRSEGYDDKKVLAKLEKAGKKFGPRADESK